jgi:NAD-dependent SIR2 family protein deacetylase
MGIDYSDLCRVECLKTRPSLFYGFWGSCFNAYNEATPHHGYEILKEWCDKKQKKDSSVAPYFFYTSNVDGHLKRFGFSPDRIHEMHGSMDTWLVLDSTLDDPIEKNPRQMVLPPEFRFPVCQETLELDHATILARLQDVSESALSPSSTFRPRVLMFDDGWDAHEAMGMRESSDIYQTWEEWMESQMAARGSAKLVVLEIGCGVRVPSVRLECETVIHDTASRCLNTAEKRCTHIRINPEDAAIELPADELRIAIETISIQGCALSTLLEIEQAMRL